MMRQMRRWLLTGALAAVVGVIGCSDWESSGDEGSWDDSYSWLDFSGVYADIAGGVLVRDGASGTSSQTAVNEVVATGNGTSTSFSGAFANGGVVAGSVLISAGAFGFVDDGAGTLTSPDGFAATVTETAVYDGNPAGNFGVVSGAPGVPGSASITISTHGVIDGADADGILESTTIAGLTGTFVYETGAWSLHGVPGGVAPGTTITITYQQADTDTTVSGSIAYSSGGWTINLQGTALPAGTQVLATYRYTETRSAAATSANSGNPIYTFNVLQTGESLRIIDSNGNEFEGQLYDVNSSAGDLTGIPTGSASAVANYIASFYADGTANGVTVSLEGTLVGTVLETEQANTLFDRLISGSWLESSGNAGVFLGSTAPISTSGAVTTTTTTE